jgi:RHS repeat-associated protein
VNGIATTYLYDGQNPIQEQRGATILANTMAGPNLDEWYARTEAGQTVSYLPDALGSTLALTNAAQGTVTSYTYEPYGRTVATGSATGNAFAYTGREEDGTGLYFYRARYYSPNLGRFVSEDPAGLAGGYNLQAYVGGNPIRYTDPTGEAKWPAIIWCILGGICNDANNPGNHEREEPTEVVRQHKPKPGGSPDPDPDLDLDPDCDPPKKVPSPPWPLLLIPLILAF